MGWVIAGGGLQIVGFVLVAVELTRIQRREFGTPRWLARAIGWIRRRLGLSKDVVLEVPPMTAVASMSVSGIVRRPPGGTLESRVGALEKNFSELESEVEGIGKRLEGQIGETRELLDKATAELARRRDEDEARRKDFLRGSIALQAWGTGFFVVGTILGVIGAVA